MRAEGEEPELVQEPVRVRVRVLVQEPVLVLVQEPVRVPGQEPVPGQVPVRVPGQVPVRVPGQVPEAEVQAAWGLEQVLALGRVRVRVRVRETRESARALGLVPHCFRSAPGGSTHCCRLHILQWPLSGTAR